MIKILLNISRYGLHWFLWEVTNLRRIFALPLCYGQIAHYVEAGILWVLVINYIYLKQKRCKCKVWSRGLWLAANIIYNFMFGSTDYLLSDVLTIKLICVACLDGFSLIILFANLSFLNVCLKSEIDRTWNSLISFPFVLLIFLYALVLQ